MAQVLALLHDLGSLQKRPDQPTGWIQSTGSRKTQPKSQQPQVHGWHILMIGGMVAGTLDLFKWSMSKKCVSTLSIYLATLLFYLSFGT